MSSIRVATTVKRHSRDAVTLRPLTHHEILRLIPPFTERGWQIDMASTEREERLLRFKIVEHPAAGTDQPASAERLSAAVSHDNEFLLVRELSLADDRDGVALPTLTASGPDAAVLLDQFRHVPPHRHFASVDGVTIRQSYRLEPSKKNADRKGADWDIRLVAATAEFDTLRVEFDAEIRNLPVNVKLYPHSGLQLALPRDLLAVIGHQWRSLQDYPNHWRSTIRAATREPQRTPDIELKLERTVRHLYQTLSQPPARFHAAHRWARWRATAQSGSAIFLTLALVIGTLLLNEVGDEALIRSLAFGAPPLMVLMLFFGFDHLPNFEVPRVPKMLKQATWAISANR